jgi:hypothetical protein
MIRKKTRTLSGKEVTQLIPENAADVRKLRRLSRKKQIDNDSLADKQPAGDRER